jgi:hypothetical protein
MTARMIFVAFTVLAAMIARTPATVAQTAPATASFHHALATASGVHRRLQRLADGVTSRSATGRRPPLLEGDRFAGPQLQRALGIGPVRVPASSNVRALQHPIKELPGVLGADDRHLACQLQRTDLIGPEMDREPTQFPHAPRSIFQQAGPSPLWDALDRCLTTLDAATGRRAVVVFTDAARPATTRIRRGAGARDAVRAAVYLLRLPDSRLAVAAEDPRHERLNSWRPKPARGWCSRASARRLHLSARKLINGWPIPSPVSSTN